MKQFTKVVIIISSIFIVIGLTSFFIGLIFGVNSRENDLKNNIDFSRVYYGVYSLDINLNFGELIIKEGDEFEVVASNIIKNRFRSELDNGTLFIEGNKRQQDFFSSLLTRIVDGSIFFKTTPKIIVYIPNEINFNEVNLVIGAGATEIDKINTKKLNVKVGTGSLMINNLYSKNSIINCGVGNVTINGIMLGNNEVECGIGSVIINVDGKKENYNYTYSVGIGSVTINEKTYSGVVNGKIDNSAKNNFNINCGIGNTIIKVKE